jgi:hypothetical protein
MSKLFQIPESSLEALLREAGRKESVEDYMRSVEVRLEVQKGQRLLKRARAAYWSRFWLLLSALVSWSSFLSKPDPEGFVIGAVLTGMTVVEFRVYSLFLAADKRGSSYGWWNQCLFALMFLLYGGYHGTFVSAPADLGGMIDPDMFPMIESSERLIYYTIAIVGAAGQFCLACYYRAARR